MKKKFCKLEEGVILYIYEFEYFALDSLEDLYEELVNRKYIDSSNSFDDLEEELMDTVGKLFDDGVLENPGTSYEVFSISRAYRNLLNDDELF